MAPILEHEMMYPGHGFPKAAQHGGPNTPQTLYALLAQGRSLGKKVNIALDNQTALNSKVSVLEVKGPDEAAMNLQVTLTPPKIIPIGNQAGDISLATAQDLVNSQKASGTKGNGDYQLGPNILWAPMIAIVEWGIGGIAVEAAEVDIMNGVNLNLSASYLRVRVEVDPYINLRPYSAQSALYELGAFVGPGFAKPRNAQRTIYLGNVAPPSVSNAAATTQIVPIPKYATGVRCLMQTPDLSPFGAPPAYPALGWIAQVLFFSSPGPGTMAAGVDITANPMPNLLCSAMVADNGTGPGANTIPIPNGAQFCCVVNQSASYADPVLIFDLGI